MILDFWSLCAGHRTWGFVPVRRVSVLPTGQPNPLHGSGRISVNWSLMLTVFYFHKEWSFVTTQHDQLLLEKDTTMDPAKTEVTAFFIISWMNPLDIIKWLPYPGTFRRAVATAVHMTNSATKNIHDWILEGMSHNWRYSGFRFAILPKSSQSMNAFCGSWIGGIVIWSLEENLD